MEGRLVVVGACPFISIYIAKSSILFETTAFSESRYEAGEAHILPACQPTIEGYAQQTNPTATTSSANMRLGFRAPPPFCLLDQVGRWADRNRGGHESRPMAGLMFTPWLMGRAVSGRAVARAAFAALKCALLTSAAVFALYEVFPLGKLTYPKESLALPGGR